MARNTTPSISVTGTVNNVTTTRRIPVELDSQGRPIPVALTADVAFPDSIVIGASEQRDDQRTAQIIFNGFPGGVGEVDYTETEGISTARDSTLDTRYEQTVVLPPGLTQLGSNLGAFTTYGTRGMSLPDTFDRAYLLLGGLLGRYYNATTNDWDSISNVGDAVVHGRYLFLLQTNGTVSRLAGVGTPVPTDNTTITGLPLTTGGSPPARTYPAIMVFDNRLFALMVSNNNTLVLYSATNHMDLAGTSTTPIVGNWLAGGTMSMSLYVVYGHYPIRLFVWRYPPSPSSPALWCQNGNKLFYYDESGGANTWVEWATLSNRWPGANTTGSSLGLAVWTRNSNLYTVPREGVQQIKEWTGSTEDMLGPNERGGLPAASATNFTVLDQNGRYLVAFGDNGNATTTATVGKVWAMNEGRGFHNIYTSTGPVWGGFVAEDGIIVVAGSSPIAYKIPFGDERTLPQNATNRTYRTGATYALETANTDGGTPYIPKRAVRVFIAVRDINDQSALTTGTTLGIDYAVEGSPAWTLLANLSPTDVFPQEIDFPNGGVRFFRIRFRVRMTSSLANATPILRNLTLSFLRRPKRRYAYTVRVDLRDGSPAFRNASRRFGGYSAANLRAWLQALADGYQTDPDSALVAMAYGGRGNSLHPARRVVKLADFQVNPIDDADSGMGRLSATFRDLSGKQTP